SAHLDEHRAENVPAAIRVLRRWLVWQWLWREPTEKNAGRWDKPPVAPATGREMDATDPKNWIDFAAAQVASIPFDGIGFALGSKKNPSGYVVIDIDHCIDDAGSIDPRALDLVERFDSYSEVTPSRTGIRIWLRGRKPGDRCCTRIHKDKFLAT